MTVRTTRKAMTFAAPFHLPGFESLLPAGTYVVETNEEAFEGNVHTVYRRTATTIRIQRGTCIEHHAVEPEHLKEALERGQGTAREVSAPSSPVPPPTNWRWVPLWVRNTPIDGSR